MTRPSARRFRGDGHASERGESNGGLALSACAATSQAWGDEPPDAPPSHRGPGIAGNRAGAGRPGSPHVGIPSVASRRLGSCTEPPGRPGRLAGPHRPFRDARSRPRRVDQGPTPPRRRAGSTSPWSWTGSPTRSCPLPLAPARLLDARPLRPSGAALDSSGDSPPLPRSAVAVRRRRGATDPDEPKTKSDPAADAELKRRIERQVREALGDRIKSAEVRVVGRNVAIRAEASRFWQRRGVRRTLESLPGLAGYRTTIDVGD